MEGSSCCQRPALATAPAPGYCPHLQENIYLKSIVHQGFMWYSNGYTRTPSPTYSKSFAHPGSNGGYWKASPPPPVPTQGSGNGRGYWKASPPPVIGQGSGNSGGGYWKTSPPPPAAGQPCSPNDLSPQKLLHQPKYGMGRQEPADCSQNPLKQTQTSQFHRWPLEQPSNMQIQQTSSYPQHFQQQAQQERSFQPFQQQQQQPRPSFPRLPSLQPLERMPHPAQIQPQPLDRPPRPPDFQEQLEQTSFSSQLQQQSMQQCPPRPRQQHLQYGQLEKIPALEALQAPPSLEGQRELLPCQQQRIYQQQHQQQQQQQAAAQERAGPQQLQSTHHQQKQQPLHLPLIVQQQLHQLQQQQQLQPPHQQKQQPLQPPHQLQQQVQPPHQLHQQPQPPHQLHQQPQPPHQLHQQPQPPHQLHQQQIQPPHQLQQQQTQPPHQLQQQQIQPLQQLQQLQPPHHLQQQAPPSQQLQPLHQQKPSHHHHHHQQQLQLQSLQQQQQKSSCLLEECLQLPGNTQQPLFQPPGPGDQQHRSRELSYGPHQTHQEKTLEGSPAQKQRACHQPQSRDGEQCRESCQYRARLQNDPRGQRLHTANADVQSDPQNQQPGPNPSQQHQQKDGQDHRRSSLIVQPDSVATAVQHGHQGHKNTEDSHQKATEETQTTIYESHQRITDESQHRMTDESHQRITDESHQRTVQCREKGQETKHNRTKGPQSPAEVKMRRQRLSLKYQLGKFARLLGPDSPVDRCTSPEVKQPRYTNSCMYSTSSSSASININPCDTSVNSFISSEVMSPRNPGDAFTIGNDAKDCVAPSSKSGDTGSPRPNDLFFSSCSAPSMSQNCSSMECPPVARVSEPENVIVNPVRPYVVTSGGEKNVSNPLTISLTPPPTPPVPISSPKSSRSVASDPVPSKVFDKILPVCEALPGESEDIKPVTFTKSFLEPMPALPDHTAALPEHTPALPEHTPALPEDTPALPEDTTVIRVYTLMTSEQSEHAHSNPEAPAPPSSSEHITIQPENLPMDSGLYPAIPRVSPNLPDPVRDEPEVIIISDDTPTIPQISPDLPEPTGTAEATRQKSMEPKSVTSTATQPTIPTVGAVAPQAATLPHPVVITSGASSGRSSSEGRPPDGRGGQGPSTYKFFRNLCIQARFSMYIPPDLEFPCLMCNASVAGEEALYHLFFGQIQCAVCGVLVSNCRDFRTLETFNTTCVKDYRGEHNLLMWSLDPIDFVSYHMRRSLMVKVSSTGKDSSPTTAEVVDEMAKFLEKFSILKQHSPWAQAIRKCWKYVRNMQSTPDLTPRVKLKRKQLFTDSPRDTVGSSPNSKTKRVEDGAKEGPASQGPCEEGGKFRTESCEEKEIERIDGEHNTKRRKPGDEDRVSPVAEDEETRASGAGEKWFTPEGLRQHLERKASLCEVSECPSQETCGVRGHSHTPSSVSLTAKELAIARSARFPDPGSLALLESPEVESEFGDFLLSLPYNHDMLDQIIQYVSVPDDRFRRPASTREDNPSTELKGSDTDSPAATTPEGEDLASPASSDFSPGRSPGMGDSQRSCSRLRDDCLESPETMSETPQDDLFVIKEAFSLGGHPNTDCGPRKRIYKPMPKSKRKRFDATGSELSIDGDLPQLTPPDLRWPDARSTKKDFVIYRYPSGPCPEECPICYEVLCASEFVLNTVSFVASTTCRACGLSIYILQDSVAVSSSLEASLRPGPKSRTKKSLTSVETT